MKRLLLLVVALGAWGVFPVRAAEDFENLKLPPFGPRVNPDDQYRFMWMIPTGHSKAFFDAGFNLVLYFAYQGLIRSYG